MPAVLEPGVPAASAGNSLTGEALLEFALVVQRLVGEVAVEHGLSLTQVRLLRTLGPGGRRMTELAGAIGLEKPSLTGLVERAKTRGLVRLQPVRGDRRVKLVELTTEGRHVARDVRCRIEERIAHLVDCLTPRDQELLQRVISQLLSGDLRNYHSLPYWTSGERDCPDIG